MTIQERIKQVRQESGQTQEQFSASIGMKRPNYAQLEVGKQEPTFEVISSIVRIYHKSFEWLIDGKETKQKGKGYPAMERIKEGIVIGETGSVFETQLVDTSGMKLIPITDIKAAAGTGYINSDHFDETDVLRLPVHMIKNGTHLCISIRGTSMAPTLQDGGYVIIRHLDRGEWEDLISDRIYVIVDTDSKTYLKRVKNRLSGQKGFLVLTSDSPDKVSNPSFNLRVQDIQHIWYVVWYFTAKMPNIHDQYYNRLSTLEDTVQLIQQQFHEFIKKK